MTSGHHEDAVLRALTDPSRWRVLVDADLVVARKDGRSTRHFLTPRADPAGRRPLDRRMRTPHHWAPQDRTPHHRDATDPTAQVFRIVIRATPEETWDAITLLEFTTRFFHGASISISTDRYSSPGPDGSTWGDSAVLEFDPPRRLTHDHLGGSPRTASTVSGFGWAGVISGLKTLLETRCPMRG